MKELKDYLHLYLGSEWEVTQQSGEFVSGVYGTDLFNSLLLREAALGNVIVKPILRPLSDMTEKEMDTLLRLGWPSINEMVSTFKFYPNEVKRNIKHSGGVGYSGFKENGEHFVSGTLSFHHFEPEQILWLLKKHFDLFGLIDAGLAIDKATLKQQAQ